MEKELLTYIYGKFQSHKQKFQFTLTDLYGDGKPRPITRRLMQEFEKIVRDPKEGIAIYQ